jgi:hypothetical protein
LGVAHVLRHAFGQVTDHTGNVTDTATVNHVHKVVGRGVKRAEAFLERNIASPHMSDLRG